MPNIERKILIKNGETVIGFAKTYPEAVENLISDFEFFSVLVNQDTDEIWEKPEKINKNSLKIIPHSREFDIHITYLQAIGEAQKGYMLWQMEELFSKENPDTEIPDTLYVDMEKIICPRCSLTFWRHYEVTDENDTYRGVKCHACNFDYSITH